MEFGSGRIVAGKVEAIFTDIDWIKTALENGYGLQVRIINEGGDNARTLGIAGEMLREQILKALLANRYEALDMAVDELKEVAAEVTT